MVPKIDPTLKDACQMSEVRCHCGQLIARLVDAGLELKCKRCRRLLVIPFSSITGWPMHRN